MQNLHNKISFLTGNEDKFNQASLIFKDSGFILIKNSIDIPEIQSLDPKVVIEEKVKYILSNKNLDISYPFLVEDTSLYLDALNGFPGPLAKHLFLSIGAKGIADLAMKYNNISCSAETNIAYCESEQSQVFLFNGKIKGKLRYSNVYIGNGFEDVLAPDGENLKLSEMNENIRPFKNMRGIAFNNLLNFLRK